MLRNAVGEGELFEEGIQLSPFETIQMLSYFGELEAELEASKFGQYNRITNALTEVSSLDANDLTVEKLEAIPGIGPKTARFIMLYSDPKFRGIPLDTHVLKFLKNLHPDKSIPKSTPPAGKKYNELEKLFLDAADLLGKTPRELDTEVWQAYNSGNWQKEWYKADLGCGRTVVN